MTPQHVLPGSIEIGEFRVDGGHLTANLKLVVCGRPESLALFVESLGEEIGVEVDETVLDYRALTVVAEHVAAKLNTSEGGRYSSWRREVRSSNGGGFRRFKCRFPEAEVV